MPSQSSGQTVVISVCGRGWNRGIERAGGLLRFTQLVGWAWGWNPEGPPVKPVLSLTGPPGVPLLFAVRATPRCSACHMC